jgi:hypothetical protein
MSARECGTCTKCCEGYLSGNIRGYEMFKGKPCFFVKIGKGCIDYENRPKNPCKNFTCGWKIIDEMPENFKPEISGVIFTWRSTEKLNINYLKLHQAPDNPTPQILTWAFLFVLKNSINFLWEVDEKSYYFGSEDFCNEMRPIFG